MKGFRCSWCDRITEGEMAGACGTYGGKRNARKILMGESEGGKPLERPRRVLWCTIPVVCLNYKVR